MPIYPSPAFPPTKGGMRYQTAPRPGITKTRKSEITKTIFNKKRTKSRDKIAQRFYNGCFY